MLVLTEAAAEIVKAIISGAANPDGSSGPGLRITTAPETGDPEALQVSAAPQPSANDQVIEADGAHIYLEPQAAVFLDDKVLDAQLDSSGMAHFSLDVQGSAWP